MKKILVLFLILLLMIDTVSARGAFSQRVPDIPFFTGTCKLEGMRDAKHAYDCFMHFFVYWFGFNYDQRKIYEYEQSPGPVGLLRDIFVPFVALSVVTFGFMVNLNIFGKKQNWINIVMTILMVLFTLRPTGLFVRFIHIVLTLGSRWAFVLWTILFFAGTWSIFNRARLRMATELSVYQTYKSEADAIKKEIGNIKNRESEILARIATEKDEGKMSKLKEMYEKLKDEERDLRARLKDLRTSYEE